MNVLGLNFRHSGWQVCWHEGSIADLADSLRRFTPRGSTVTVISREEPEVSVLPRLHLVNNPASTVL